MQTDYIEQFSSFGKNSYQYMQELGAINAKIVQKLADLQLDFATYTFETSIEQSKLLTSTTNYKDLLSAESEFVSEYSTKTMDYTKKAASILTESREEVVGWFEKTFEKAGEAVKTKTPAKRSTAKKAS